MTKFINKIFGWRHWAIFTYNAINENFFIVLFIILSVKNYSNQYLTDVFLFFLLSFFSTSYGYLINDFADRKLDMEQGKPNTFANMSNRQSILSVSIVLGLANLLAIYFFDRSGFVLLWLLWLFLSTFYSIPPIRLKERGFPGLIVVVLAQRVLPVLLLLLALEYRNILDMTLLTIYVMLRGFSSDLNHQMEDYRADNLSDVQTFVVRTGIEKSSKIFKAILEIEKLFLFVILFRLIQVSQYYLISLPIILLYTVFYGYGEWLILHNRWSNPFNPSTKNIFQFLHHAFPTAVLPLLICGILIFLNINYLWLLLVLSATRQLFSIRIWRESYPAQLVKCLFR